MITYQQGHIDALVIPGNLEDIYVDGISLTHGAPGSRSHNMGLEMILASMVTSILVPTLIHGLILFLLSSVTITSATLSGDHDAGYVEGCIIQMNLCLTDRGMVLIVPAASSTLLHGFAWNYHNQHDDLEIRILYICFFSQSVYPLLLFRLLFIVFLC